MSSTNKTENLQLNQWIGTDTPQRIDFCSDNQILDAVISEHLDDTVEHITANERQVWNSPVYVCSFVGNGSTSREINLECDFNPIFGIIYPITYMPFVADFTNGTHLNYTGFFSPYGSSIGISLSGKKVTLSQSTIPISPAEYKYYNAKNINYAIVCFR